MDTLTVKGSCKNHPDRQASFRCTSCELFYCSECASRQENRLVCTACLHRERGEKPEKKKSQWFAKSIRWIPAALSLFVLWMSLYLAGRILVEIPADVHDGVIWKDAFD